MGSIYHVRKTIREKIKDLMTGIEGFSDSNVKFDNPEIFDNAQVPGIYINSVDETVDYQTLGGIGSSRSSRNQIRKYNISVIALIKAKDAIDEIDQLAYSIENAMLSSKESLTLGGIVKRIDLTDSDFQTSDAFDTNIASLKLDFSIFYNTVESDPSVSV